LVARLSRQRTAENPHHLCQESSFKSWLNSLVVDLGAQVIPIDGKTLKGSYDRNGEQCSLHLVSAWACEHRLFLGQIKVDDQSNEITAIPALLELLDISGRSRINSIGY
jgi:hypothetical protein